VAYRNGMGIADSFGFLFGDLNWAVQILTIAFMDKDRPYSTLKGGPHNRGAKRSKFLSRRGLK